MYFRANKKNLNNISIYTNLGNEDSDLEIIDTLRDKFDIEEYILKKENLKILETEIDNLPLRYRTVVKYRLKGMTFDKIGRLIGISQPQVSRDFQKALNILRYKFRVERGGEL